MSAVLTLLPIKNLALVEELAWQMRPGFIAVTGETGAGKPINEEARAGLGQGFKDEVDRCILWIQDHPELYRLRSGGYRRATLRVFPYYIPYVVRGESAR